MKYVRWLVVAALCLTAPASAYWQSRNSNYNIAIASGGGCAEATAAIARLDGTQDAAHNTAYTTLICNLVTAGVWAKLDVMYVFATNDETNALTNLVQSSYGASKISTPTFAADAGYTGTNASTTIAIDTNFNPTTATTPNFTQNSAHLSAWSLTDVAATSSGGAVIGLSANNLGVVVSTLLPRYSDGSAYYGINNNSAASSHTTTANGIGHYITTRSSSTTILGYKNAVSQTLLPSASVTSGAPLNANIYVLADNAFFSAASHVQFGAGNRVAIITIGGGLTATDATNLCHEENTYLNTIAGVSSGIC